jgi:hypothetical protein
MLFTDLKKIIGTGISNKQLIKLKTTPFRNKFLNYIWLIIIPPFLKNPCCEIGRHLLNRSLFIHFGYSV